MQQYYLSRARHFNLFTRTTLSLRTFTSITLAFSFFITPLAPVGAQEASTPEQASTLEQTSAAGEQTKPETSEAKEKKQETAAPDATAPTDAAKDDKVKEPKKSKDAPTGPIVGAMSSNEPNNRLVFENGQPRLPTPDGTNGALVYDVPIVVPPGRNGVQPQYSLVYNSQEDTGATIFGKGWALNIPVIKRLNRRGSQQLFSQNDFTSSLDGELVKVTGTTYVPKSEGGDFRSYTFSNNTWTVTSKQGTVYKFGYSATTRQDDPSNPPMFLLGTSKNYGILTTTT